MAAAILRHCWILGPGSGAKIAMVLHHLSSHGHCAPTGYLTSAIFLSNVIHARPSATIQKEPVPVSVLICARNEEKTIYRTIEAVVAQRYAAPIEILCVDNTSDDHTRQEMERAEKSLTRSDRAIRLISCPVPGKANALNEGLSHIHTDTFVTVDADTVLEENALAPFWPEGKAAGRPAWPAICWLPAQIAGWEKCRFTIT